MEGALEEVQKLLEKALGVHMDGGWTVFVRQSLEDALEVVSELRGQLKERGRYDKEIVQPELERLAEAEELLLETRKHLCWPSRTDMSHDATWAAIHVGDRVDDFLLSRGIEID